jgi:hypothetical protein
MPEKLIQPTTLSDIEYVATNLQEADRREIEGLGFTDMFLALSLSSSHSDPAITFWNNTNNICGIAGVSRTDAHCGAIWMMTTPDVRAYPRQFLQEARKWVDQQTSFDVLHNIADPRNNMHMKLLHLLGFKKLGYVRVGPDQLTYVEFAKLTKCVYH